MGSPRYVVPKPNAPGVHFRSRPAKSATDMTDQFTYVTAFLSIVVALAMTHLLGGVAAILRDGIARHSPVYYTWLAILLFSCVDFWFSLWGLRTTAAWPLPFVLFLLVSATLLYLACHLVVPGESEPGPFDGRAFHDRHRRRYVGTFFLYLLSGTAANLMIAGFAGAVAMNAVTLALLALAWWRRETAVQVGVALALLALLGYYAVNFIPALR